MKKITNNLREDYQNFKSLPKTERNLFAYAMIISFTYALYCGVMLCVS